jgi:hypothetical protein
MTFGLSGFGGAFDWFQPIVGWWLSSAPEDVRAWVAGSSRSGRLLVGTRGLLPRPEHLFIQPEVLGVALGSLLNPCTLETM